MITTEMCASYRRELFEAQHDHRPLPNGSSFYMALYSSSAVLDQSTRSYQTLNEVVGQGYTAGGKLLVNSGANLVNGVAVTEFADVVWEAETTVTARGCLIYNFSNAGKSVSAHDFGQEFSSIRGFFVVNMPVPNNITGLLRLV